MLKHKLKQMAAYYAIPYICIPGDYFWIDIIIEVLQILNHFYHLRGYCTPLKMEYSQFVLTQFGL